MKNKWAMGALALFAAQAGWAGLIVNTQTTACLDNSSHCSFAGSGTLTNGAESNTFTQAATATSGIMHISAASTFSVNNSEAWSLAFVQFKENLTINSASKNGQTGHLVLGYRIDGTVAQSGVADSFLQVVSRVYAPTLQNYVKDYNTNTDGSFIIPLVYTFIYGQQFTLDMSMQAMVGTANDLGNGYQLVNRTGTGSGNVNFINTLVVNQLTTNDVNDQNVSDSTFTADSGAVYTQAGVSTVPEPATILMAAFGIVAIVLHRTTKPAYRRS